MKLLTCIKIKQNKVREELENKRGGEIEKKRGR